MEIKGNNQLQENETKTFISVSHARYVSLLSRSHPIAMSVEEQLNRIRSSEAAASSSASSASQKLRILKDLYDCTEDFLKLPLTQQALSNARLRSSVEELLDGSLELLDVCGNMKDAFSQMKECIKELESVLRRRKGGDCCLAKEVEAYMSTRKRLQKIIFKYLVHLKKMERKNSLNKDSNREATLSMLRQVEEIRLSVFASFLCFLSQSSANLKRSSWSLASKLLPSKQVACEGEEDVNEMAILDSELLSLKSVKASGLSAKDILKRLDALESSLQEVDEDLGCIFRRLVKTRVSLLNIVNH
ncbi:uncharacterized protein LOC104451693 [Eucalyptus grandis]|uniref:uncharacterized protein LOC104451693 n=1 Tax=Eucalyptus grandis TaxID=71139 RepID=UPI00192ED36F|nr:uncharacterized protein LOC104451693 [Eucalyptus grandis]